MHAINQIINVNAFYFEDAFSKDQRKGHASRQSPRQVKAYPRQIEFGSTQYTFSGGLQRLVQHGQRVVRLFDMTDGRTHFRLVQEGGEWTLLGTKQLQVGA